MFTEKQISSAIEALHLSEKALAKLIQKIQDYNSLCTDIDDKIEAITDQVSELEALTSEADSTREEIEGALEQLNLEFGGEVSEVEFIETTTIDEDEILEAVEKAPPLQVLPAPIIFSPELARINSLRRFSGLANLLSL